MRYCPWGVNGVGVSGSGGIGTVLAGSVNSIPVQSNGSGAGYDAIATCKIFEFIYVGQSNTFYNSNATDTGNEAKVVTSGWAIPRCLAKPCRCWDWCCTKFINDI